MVRILNGIFMKKLYASLTILFLFIFGCSHTYEVSKYYSKEDLYKEFNESAQNKDELKITFTNDSSIFVYNGAEIRNDTMFLKDTSLLNYNSKIPISQIKQLSYNNHFEGALPGLLLGTVAGGAIGATGWIYHPEGGGMGGTPTFSQFQATIFCAIFGLFSGAMTGIVLGFNYYFLFNH